jgi:FHS family Na+ dependent glucose MFS transporter 1
LRPDKGQKIFYMKAKMRQSRTLGYFTAFVALGMASAALGPALPSLADHTRSQLSEISFLFTAHALGYLLGSFQGGRLYDRIPGHPLIAVVLIAMAAMLALVPLMSFLWALALVMLILGVAGGAVDVGGNTMLVWVHGRKVGPFMNGLHFCFGAGSFLSPIILAMSLSLSGDVTWGYWVLALAMVPAAIWLFPLPSPTAQAAPDGSVEERDIASSANDKGTGTGHRTNRLILLIALLLFLYVAAEAAFGGWIFTYARDSKLAAAASAAYLTSAFWGALTFGRLLAIPIAARVRPIRILFADLAGCLASLGTILLWPDSPLALWVGTLGLGFSMASIFPTAISLAERHLPITGQATGWFLVGASAGAMFLPWLIGQMYDERGPQVAMMLIAIDLVVALGILITWTLYASPVDTTRQVVV